MSARRALTLVEVLAAACLLSLLAAACLPLLRDAATASPTAPPDIDLLDLAGVADEAMTKADAKADGALPPADDVARLEWPDHPDRPPVLARVLRDVDGGADHAWVVFECDGLAVSRWMKVESPTVAEDSP